MPPDRNMADSGRFINLGITKSDEYDHTSIVQSIPDDMGHVEAAGMTPNN